MDAEQFLETIREERATELDRLGSEKSLIAETGAILDPATVLRTAAAGERRAQKTFEQWAADERDEAVSQVFEAIAEREREHYELVMTDLDDKSVTADVDALHEHLRDLDGTVERLAAGMVGRPLVSARTLLQMVNFFINEADTANADRFRELRRDTETIPPEGAKLLVKHCKTDCAWNIARESATQAIDVTYEEYAETLLEMGVDPKPVC